MANSLILNIPHASPAIPTETLVMRKNGPWIGYGKWARHNTLSRELPYFTDWFTDELFNNGIGSPIIAPVSRVLCDTERFEDDEQEPMAKIGFGVCYSTGHTMNEKFSYDSGHREAVIEKYYRPHHQTLENTVGRALCEFKTPIILDCHSFASVPLPYEPDQNPDRPDICIGSDDHHTPTELVEMTKKYFQSKGFKVKINSPYAGSIVPMLFYKKDSRVKTIMLEINRKLYMDEESIQKNEHFQELKHLISQYEKQLEALEIGLQGRN